MRVWGGGLTGMDRGCVMWFGLSWGWWAASLLRRGGLGSMGGEVGFGWGALFLWWEMLGGLIGDGWAFFEVMLGAVWRKEKSMNRESGGDDERLSSHIKLVSQLRVEGDHHEEKGNEKRKIHNFTPELRMTLSKQKSTNRESEGDDKRITPSKEKSSNWESGGDDESKP
ncbi:hypothetical protein Tco_0152469 [Tanacetum coccineum]